MEPARKTVQDHPGYLAVVGGGVGVLAAIPLILGTLEVSNHQPLQNGWIRLGLGLAVVSAVILFASGVLYCRGGWRNSADRRRAERAQREEAEKAERETERQSAHDAAVESQRTEVLARLHREYGRIKRIVGHVHPTASRLSDLTDQRVHRILDAYNWDLGRLYEFDQQNFVGASFDVRLEGQRKALQHAVNAIAGLDVRELGIPVEKPASFSQFIADGRALEQEPITSVVEREDWNERVDDWRKRASEWLHDRNSADAARFNQAGILQAEEPIATWKAFDGQHSRILIHLGRLIRSLESLRSEYREV